MMFVSTAAIKLKGEPLPLKTFRRMGRAERNPSFIKFFNLLMGFAPLYPSYLRTSIQRQYFDKVALAF
jgi:hypothetical protein